MRAVDHCHVPIKVAFEGGGGPEHKSRLLSKFKEVSQVLVVVELEGLRKNDLN